MLEKIKNSSQYKEVKRNVKLVGRRLAEQHVRLAVTGLSRSGKTAFITSLVNQLLEAKDGAELPFFNVLQEGRLVGVRRDAQPDVTVSRFTYEDGLARLQQTPPQWPLSTNGVSQVRLQIKYRNQAKLRKLLSTYSTLTLDITDYPGEWLLDLPLLELDYKTWCEGFWQEMELPHKAELAHDYLKALSSFDPSAVTDEMQLESLSKCYTEFLLSCKQAGYQLIQPGRFVLPGNLAGAPVLQFFPLSKEQFDTLSLSDLPAESNAALLNQRFEGYKKSVVKPFYSDHFKGFDRQIILLDCLSALNQGKHSFEDLRNAVNWLLRSFHYGHSNFLSRIFSPNIDRLIFAASKADHVTPDQHENLVKLLDSLVNDARKHIQFEGVVTESTAIAGIRASTASQVLHDGRNIQVIKGTDRDGKPITLYPGDVPTSCPEDAFWQQQHFEFPNFSPAEMTGNKGISHIRMDQILQFILADKME